MVEEVQQRDEELVRVLLSAVKRSIGSTTGCTITEKAPTRAFSWLKAPTSAVTFKTLLRHYAKRALTLVGAFSVIVQPVVEPMEHYTALIAGLGHVILGILNGQRHLPFKESKVTQLLREVLGSVSCQVGGGTILAKNISTTEFQAILL